MLLIHIWPSLPLLLNFTFLGKSRTHLNVIICTPGSISFKSESKFIYITIHKKRDNLTLIHPTCCTALLLCPCLWPGFRSNQRGVDGIRVKNLLGRGRVIFYGSWGLIQVSLPNVVVAFFMNNTVQRQYFPC